MLVDVELDRHRPPDDQPLVADLPGEMARWAEAGATELVIGLRPSRPARGRHAPPEEHLG